ncbi:serine hydrolase domain-containing protein [Thalassotalea nanhaiensis]|uniref:Serine hydrolase domain-containing protein n=1 Tax=Thalassotalea nanhaiensis TaxID=3065648 RepID=A0ABY9TJ01_9GAMM|nr:serine hydrolase domain-containing protein [Colwelliaceae bacterium SQ345]
MLIKLVTKLLILVSISNFCFAEQANFDSQKIDKHILKYVEEEDFRGVVLVAKEGKVLFKSAYGNADDSNKTLNTVNNKFLIGSLTKSFTAVTVMKLVDEGKLNLNAPLATYIPKLNTNISKNLTLHLLLKHQSGLPQHLERIVSFEEKDVSSDEILDIINTASLAFTPGKQYQYSNLNYHLAAIAIENVMAKTYAEVLQEKIFIPLNMKNSGVERLSNIPANRSNGYRKGVLGINRDENIVSYALGSGDIYSTVDDLLNWEQSLYSSKLLSEESQKLLFAGESQEFGNYGYGFRIQKYQRASTESKGTLTRHGGSMNGFLSNLHRYTDDKLTVIILANIRSFPIRNLTFELKEIALGLDVGDRNRKRFE